MIGPRVDDENRWNPIKESSERKIWTVIKRRGENKSKR